MLPCDTRNRRGDYPLQNIVVSLAGSHRDTPCFIISGTCLHLPLAAASTFNPRKKDAQRANIMLRMALYLLTKKAPDWVLFSYILCGYCFYFADAPVVAVNCEYCVAVFAAGGVVYAYGSAAVWADSCIKAFALLARSATHFSLFAHRRGEYYSPAHRMCRSTKTIVRWTSVLAGVEGACRCQWQMKAST